MCIASNDKILLSSTKVIYIVSTNIFFLICENRQPTFTQIPVTPWKIQTRLEFNPGVLGTNFRAQHTANDSTALIKSDPRNKG